MPLQKPRTGTAKVKRNCWTRGNGPYSYRGELKQGLSLNRRYLNRKVRYSAGDALKGNDYKKNMENSLYDRLYLETMIFTFGEHGLLFSMKLESVLK